LNSFDLSDGVVSPDTFWQHKSNDDESDEAGNLVRGMKNKSLGKIILNQLNSPHAANSSPNATSHFGKSFMKPDGTEMPAIKSPKGTEYLRPPTANVTLYKLRTIETSCAIPG